MKKYPHYLERLQAATRKFWEKPALNNIGGETFTYEQMARTIAHFHVLFENSGIKKGDKIALCAQNGARWGFAYLAVNTYETIISVRISTPSDVFPIALSSQLLTEAAHVST
jgi:long-chain acyl-CoA synthetase